MREFTAVVERCDAHGHYLGHVPGLQGACAEGQTLRELTANLREVIESLLCDEQPTLRVEIVNNETALV
ncbi:MAG: type II toxin-antitoxin system HicB family antitoxin [Kiritimatiellae bacterium]|nr:type II toxin-antitoxin system HicB family antitoxin [Kiritimatiellia bacterium]